MSYNSNTHTHTLTHTHTHQEPTCVIVKHTNPCGVATRPDLLEAYRLAVAADPISAFGGIVAFNRPVDAELAKEIREYRCVCVCCGVCVCVCVCVFVCECVCGEAGIY